MKFIKLASDFLSKPILKTLNNTTDPPECPKIVKYPKIGKFYGIVFKCSKIQRKILNVTYIDIYIYIYI